MTILAAPLSYLVSSGGFLAKYFRIFEPLKKPVFAEDLERNKISALNGNILAIYIGDSFSDYLDMFGAKKRMNFGNDFSEYLPHKRGPQKVCPQNLEPYFFC